MGARSITHIALVMINVFLVGATILDARTHQRRLKAYRPLRLEKEQETSSASVMLNDDEKDIDIIATYTDATGTLQATRVKMKDLSASWVLENPADGGNDQQKGLQVLKLKDSYQAGKTLEESLQNAMVDHQPVEGEIQYAHVASMNPVKLRRRALRLKRRDLRVAELIKQDKEADKQIQAALAAVKQSKNADTHVKGKYSIWRRDFESLNSDSVLKLMRDQIIMAKTYANIAKSKNQSDLYNSLMEHIRGSLHVIGEANSDADLHPSSLDRAKAMGHVLSIAKDQLYDCHAVARKLRVMLQSTEENLAADYFLHRDQNTKDINKEKLEDPSLYHYAIFSDNVLATSVVVNSTVLHANEPEKHVFHIVTDKLNFAAMKRWFLVNAPEKAAVQVENIDGFKWLNSSYCSVLRQLESARVKEYYFKANHPSSLSIGSDHLKYRNPKYLSMLNHLRFYLPEVYPKLEKILFLDDDIVVQKDLTALWSIDLQGMVNGAVETCKESFHRFDKYLNFSNPKISENFNPNACGWAFGMNIFDLKEWRKRNITGIYHHWQDLNEDRTLWKLGTLPPGLITFYNRTFPLDRNWHVLGLGYDPALNHTEIENAAVIHYNGNYKPWLDLAVTKYKSYWSKYVMFNNYYLQLCNISE
ncbi:hypothetical protein SLE2022_117880 [Rubroshorea leprosula]